MYKEAKKYIAEINKRRITSLEPGDSFYLDIRTYGHLWYQQLNLHSSDFVTYVVKCDVISWEVRGFKLLIKDQVLRSDFIYRHFDVASYAYRRLIQEGEVLVDLDFVREYPQLLQK